MRKKQELTPEQRERRREQERKYRAALTPEGKAKRRAAEHKWRAKGTRVRTQEQKKRRRENQQAWRIANREKVREHYEKHIEQAREASKKSNQKHRDKLNVYYKKYYREHREAKCQANKVWHKEHPEEHRQIGRNRRAREIAAQGSHTPADIVRLFELQKGTCAACTVVLIETGKGRFHIDHIMPLSRGGSDGADNLQLLCGTCNRRKGSTLPSEWRKVG